jgi:uncharacterized protein (DUF1778 family)
MKKGKASKPLSGGAKMKLAGKRGILLGVTPEVYDTLRAAADREMRPLTQFILFHAMVAAERRVGGK